MADIKALVVHRLVNVFGWKPDRLLDNLVSKAIKTAAGGRSAGLWVAYSQESKSFWMHGEYWSEGNNALSTCFAIIPETASEAEVSEKVDEFIKSVEDRINNTFAVRLLRKAA